MNTVATLSETLSPAVREAIQEQQERLWRLRSLLACLADAAESTRATDIESALKGLVDYANAIDSGLEPEALMKVASEIHRTNALREES